MTRMQQGRQQSDKHDGSTLVRAEYARRATMQLEKVTSDCVSVFPAELGPQDQTNALKTGYRKDAVLPMQIRQPPCDASPARPLIGTGELTKVNKTKKSF